MEIKIFHFFYFILIVAIFSIIFIKPTNITNFSSNNIAIFEFSNFNIYKITKDKLDLVLMASHAYTFKDKTLIENLSISRFLKNSITEYLTSKEAILKGDNLNLRNMATYHKSDGLFISTEDLNYNFKDKIVKSEKPFQINFLTETKKEHIFRGENFLFEKNSGKVFANKIKASINLK